ncbi:GIY-YIG nuclease family protein [Nocardia sp. NPDC003693]
MGYVYAFRLGKLEQYKIGQTTATPEKRRSPLQTSCSERLTLFDAIETDEYKALEKHIKDRWGQRRSTEGGTEIYHLSEPEATQLFSEARAWLTDELPKLRRAAELESLEPEPEVLTSDEQTLALRGQWFKLRDEESRARQEYEQAAAERVRVETELKLAIGTASGIEGVATWGVGVKSRRISGELIREREPVLYEQSLVATLSAEKFKTLLGELGREGEYETFQEVRHSRKFQIIE